jgi:hypothetical protein
MINGNACFAYFNKNWGIPNGRFAVAAKLRRGIPFSLSFERFGLVWLFCSFIFFT